MYGFVEWYSKPRATKCDSCPTGTYSGPAASNCTECKPGTYNPYQNKSACKECELGRCVQ